MDYLMLVNKENALPEGVKVRLSFADGKLAEYQTAKSYLNMKKAAFREGLRLRAMSGYRSVSYQEGLLRAEAEGYLRQGFSEGEALRLALRSVAPPGKSEHNTGLALDIVRECDEELSEGFENTAEFRWLTQNAHKFGFILRYPRGKTAVTGYIYEPWHYRFVGCEAEKIAASGLCLEEYLKVFHGGGGFS